MTTTFIPDGKVPLAFDATLKDYYEAYLKERDSFWSDSAFFKGIRIKTRGGRSTKVMVHAYSTAVAGGIYSKVRSRIEDIERGTFNFDVPSYPLHVMTKVEEQEVQLAQTSMDAFVEGMLPPIKDAVRSARDLAARRFFSTGWGEIGQVIGVEAANKVIHLNRGKGISPDHRLVFAAGLNSGTLRDSGAVAKVMGVDYDDDGDVKVELDAIPSGVVTGDYAFLESERDNAASPKQKGPAGVQGWIPVDRSKSFLSVPFFNVDRSKDAVGLAGVSLKILPKGKILPVLRRAMQRCNDRGGNPSVIVCNFKTFELVFQEIKAEGLVYHEPDSANKYIAGASAVGVVIPGMSVRLVTDEYVPNNVFYGLDEAAWFHDLTKDIINLDDFPSNGDWSSYDPNKRTSGLRMNYHEEADWIGWLISANLFHRFVCVQPSANFVVTFA